MPLTRVRAATDGHLTAFAGVFPCKLLTDSSPHFDFEREDAVAQSSPEH
jgi:hypothetical protein